MNRTSAALSRRGVQVPPDVVSLKLLQYVGAQGHDLLFVLFGVQIVFGLADGSVPSPPRGRWCDRRGEERRSGRAT